MKEIRVSLWQGILYFFYVCVGVIVLVSAAVNWIDEQAKGGKHNAAKQAELTIAGADDEGPRRVWEGK